MIRYVQKQRAYLYDSVPLLVSLHLTSTSSIPQQLCLSLIKAIISYKTRSIFIQLHSSNLVSLILLHERPLSAHKIYIPHPLTKLIYSRHSHNHSYGTCACMDFEIYFQTFVVTCILYPLLSSLYPMLKNLSSNLSPILLLESERWDMWCPHAPTHIISLKRGRNGMGKQQCA